jgi:hypothetical protein
LVSETEILKTNNITLVTFVYNKGGVDGIQLYHRRGVGDSGYCQTIETTYPAMKRISNNPEEIQRSENHHPPIIDKETFNIIQRMKKS